MEKLLVFGVNDTDYQKIRSIASRMRLGCERVLPDAYGCTLGQILDGAVSASPVTHTFSESLLVMCDLSGKRIDKLLFELRHGNVTVDYKAILTPTNRNWTVPQVFFEMHKEKTALRQP